LFIKHKPTCEAGYKVLEDKYNYADYGKPQGVKFLLGHDLVS